jgi:hypothetical protein
MHLPQELLLGIERLRIDVHGAYRVVLRTVDSWIRCIEVTVASTIGLAQVQRCSVQHTYRNKSSCTSLNPSLSEAKVRSLDRRAAAMKGSCHRIG